MSKETWHACRDITYKGTWILMSNLRFDLFSSQLLMNSKKQCRYLEFFCLQNWTSHSQASFHVESKFLSVILNCFTWHFLYSFDMTSFEYMCMILVTNLHQGHFDYFDHILVTGTNNSLRYERTKRVKDSKQIFSFAASFSKYDKIMLLYFRSECAFSNRTEAINCHDAFQSLVWVASMYQPIIARANYRGLRQYQC